ncbi:hypothetical protein [Azospirillum himalayense]|uniref:Uncharacterized protein n=1 Tax=Azospirillum himalayense TaxID=654847 RepID=A0ABW0GD57_9PROT
MQADFEEGANIFSGGGEGAIPRRPFGGGRAAQLNACPTLITQAEDDALTAGAGAVFDALTGPRTLMRFTAAEGADGPCEMGSHSLLNLRILAWLDRRFEGGG